MANKYYHGLSDSGATERGENAGVLEDTPTISDSKIEVVVDFYNYAGTLDEQVEGEKAADDDDYDDGKASDKDDNENNDCDDISLVDTYPYDSQQSHVSPIIPNTNGNVPLVVESDKPDEPGHPKLAFLLLKLSRRSVASQKDGLKRTAKRSCKPYPSNAHEMERLLYEPPRAPGDVQVCEDDQRG
ncbi:hypothetical protein EYC80_004184 [Monilinia laxa]|uniref:Uncharacterized protein n=1 Tax=Monilinia laxa TaxID=61186 RepID=A0A5N6KMJ1_MONLA|nr:hypothetical protein EYC80_004184 [Monilinia laxa]